jgi:hypothetical protein
MTRRESTQRPTPQNYNIIIKPYDELKKHRTFTVAPSANYFQFDIVYFGEKSYLFIMGTNNKFVWTSEITGKSVAEIRAGIKKILSLETFPKFKIIFLDGDGEKGFGPLNNTTIDGRKLIINSVPDKTHNRFGLLNRMVRTIRHFANIIYGMSGEDTLEPEQLNEILEKYYNYSFHRTLSQLIGFKVSPADLLFDRDLEGFFVKTLIYLNFRHRDRDKLKIGDKVRVYHQKKNIFQKAVFEMEPDQYTVTNIINRKYEVTARSDTDPTGRTSPKNKLLVPRYYLMKIN